MIKEELLEIKLDDLPYSYREWKTLVYYRIEWNFLPTTLQNRVSEQLMSADYIITLDKWLKPKIIIEQKQRILLIQTLASIYEGVLSYLVTLKLKNYITENKGLKRIYDNSTFYGDKRTFKPTLELSLDMELINEPLKSKLEKILDIRNWIHLSNEEKPDLINWAMNKTCADHRKDLNDFRDFIKNKFK